MNEDDPIELLKEMAKKKVLVEICLTSNDVILGVSGDRHPLPIYMKYGVPVALATDDEGVARSDITQEYLRAVETYGLSYADLKRMARASLEHSFLPGESLWNDTVMERNVGPCEMSVHNFGLPSAACKAVLDHSDHARLQFELERAFAEFEKKF